MGAKVRWRKDRDAWYLIIHHNGEERKRRFGPSSADKRRAERQANEINRAIRRGQLGLERREEAIPFDEFARAWVDEKVIAPSKLGVEGAVAPRTAAMREFMVRLHLIPYLGSRDLRSIDVATVDALESHLISKQIGKTARTLSRRTVDMILGTLRLILAHAEALGKLRENAVDRWKSTSAVRGRPRASRTRRRVVRTSVLDSEEREALLAAFANKHPHYYPFVLFLAEVGCRFSEPLSLTWDDVDLLRQEVRLFRSKTGDEGFVELSDRITAELRRVRHELGGDTLVFRTPGGAAIRYDNFRHRIWDPVAVSVFGQERRIRPHTLRHSWVTLHLSRGTPIEWIRVMGGWASSRVLLDVYSHLIPSESRGFANILTVGDRPRPTQARKRVSLRDRLVS